MAALTPRSHPWQSVTAANWRKYPNPFNPAVLSADVLDREITPTGTLRTHRLMTTVFKIPEWAVKACVAPLLAANPKSLNHVRQMLGHSRCYVSEVSEVDPAQQVLSMHSRNVSFNETLVMDEHIEYRADPQNPNRHVARMPAGPLSARRTIMTQECRVTVSLYGGSYLESVFASTIAGNATKGRQAIEHVISTLDAEVQSIAQNIRDATSVRARPALPPLTPPQDLLSKVPAVHCDNTASGPDKKA